MHCSEVVWLYSVVTASIVDIWSDKGVLLSSIVTVSFIDIWSDKVVCCDV